MTRHAMTEGATPERLDVRTGGEAMGLLLASGSRTLRRADGFACGVAGSEWNVAVGLARLGRRVAFAGRVGADPAGGWVRDTLRAEGVDLDGLITDPALPTGILLRDSPLAGPVSVSYYRFGDGELDLLGLPADPAKLLSGRLNTVVVKRGADAAGAAGLGIGSALEKAGNVTWLREAVARYRVKELP